MKYSRFLPALVAMIALNFPFLGAQSQEGLQMQPGDFTPAQQAFAGNYGSFPNSYTPSAYGQQQPAMQMVPPMVPSPMQQAQWTNGAPVYQSNGSSPGTGGNWVDSFNTPPDGGASFRQDPTTVRIHQAAPVNQPAMIGGITERDLHVLEQHDVAVIVDRSLSMTTRDCPGVSPDQGGWQAALGGLLSQQMPGYQFSAGGTGMSRWDFVLSQTMALAQQTSQIFPHGITLVLFSSHCRVFKNVAVNQLPQIFAMNHPWGSTNTAEALETQIDDYFARRQATRGHLKPLAIAIVTDGMPTNPDSLKRLIIETTHHMQNPHEIRITFLQIGTERKGFEELNELDNFLTHEGARFDIVETKPFPEVVRAGLARSLVEAIEH